MFQKQASKNYNKKTKILNELFLFVKHFIIDEATLFTLNYTNKNNLNGSIR